MKLQALAAAVFLSTVHSATGQSLVSTATADNRFQVAASYGYSQVHHDGEWILVDVAVQSKQGGVMKLHEAFSLITPAGERIDLPSQREYRAGLKEINAMQTSAELMQQPTVVGSPGCQTGYVDAYGLSRPRRSCFSWNLWGNSGVTWVVTVGTGRGPGTVALYFRSPTGEWPAGKYTLVVDGPGDLEARLPVRLH